MSRTCTTLLLAVSLAACGGSGTEAPFGDPSQPSDAATFDAPSSVVITDSGVHADAKSSSDTGVKTPSSDAGVGLDAAVEVGSDTSSPTKAGASLLAAEAHRELTAMITSTYQHTTYVDEATGEFDYDCSGFANYALSRALPDALTTLVDATETRPLAKDYEGFFASITGSSSAGRWHRVARAIDLVPGDVVSWLEPPGKVTSDTGHVMIVRELPTPNPSDSTEILVPITDSTSTPHGPSDSRTPSGATGLGTGTIGLIVDGSGAPIEYRWTGGYSTARVTTEIALGHVE